MFKPQLEWIDVSVTSAVYSPTLIPLRNTYSYVFIKFLFNLQVTKLSIEYMELP